MLRYAISRLVIAALMVLLATLVIFLIANMVPGDPVLTQLGDIAANNPDMVAAFRHRWGLDLPLWDRYWIFLTGVFHGDLGVSIGSQRPVLDDIAQYAPATVELSTIAFLLSLLVGLPLGVLAAMKRDTWIDHLARSISLVGVSAPTFWLAFVMLAVFYGALEWAPGPGQISASTFPPPTVTGIMLIDAPLAGDWDTFWDAASHLVLPSIVLAASTLGLITRTTRAAMLEALSQDYIRVARAKGLARRAIMLGHALPNALLPVVTLGGLAYAQLLTGTVLTESIFSWPGLGRYTFQSAVRLDFPGHHGHHACRRGDLCDGQPAGRSVLRGARSARVAAMSGVEAALLAATTESGSGARRRRWLRRYGLAALGAVVIALWAIAAILAPWIAPYPPDVVNVAGRLLPPSDLAHCLGTDVLGRDVFTRRDLRRAHVAHGRLHRGAARRAVRHVARRDRRVYARLRRGVADAG